MTMLTYATVGLDTRNPPAQIPCPGAGLGFAYLPSQCLAVGVLAFTSVRCFILEKKVRPVRARFPHSQY